MHLSFLFNFFIFKMCICSIYKVLAFSFGSVFSSAWSWKKEVPMLTNPHPIKKFSIKISTSQAAIPNMIPQGDAKEH